MSNWLAILAVFVGVPIVAWAAPAPSQPARVQLNHVRRFVLDPGHGGDNLGALGTGGIREKALTLAASLRIAHWLRQNCDVQVLLTRERDDAVELRQRPRLANDWKADALVSVHANAHDQGEAAGMEVFFLAADASAEASRQLVEREEGTAAGAPNAGKPWSVGGIKNDLALAAAHARSQAFAYALGDALQAGRKKVRFRGVRQAAFGVLKEAQMPALVLELGYITHPVEGPQLFDPAVQDEFARALLRALVALDKRLGQERKAEARQAAQKK
ncbi:MAG: N-acetylmuramoyl-L-alanine amidase [Deltaproteobacteria bacterium]|nr:N-acetylmuramoyl-L-alanine amidase [Deltaproteobacteria bacterium]